MKVSLMRSAMVLAVALGLASCGGKATFTIEGTVNGLVYEGLELSNNGKIVKVAPAPAAVPVAPVPFAFPDQIEYGEVYKVEVKTQPAHQTCTPRQPTDTNTAGRIDKINVVVDCALKESTLGGKIEGLTADGLVLANGSTGGAITVAKDATTFVFQNTVPYGQSYGVTVQAQPTGQTCNVLANGSGVMGDTNVENVIVRCAANT